MVLVFPIALWIFSALKEEWLWLDIVRWVEA
jgi:hypothetical protein